MAGNDGQAQEVGRKSYGVMYVTLPTDGQRQKGSEPRAAAGGFGRQEVVDGKISPGRITVNDESKQNGKLSKHHRISSMDC